MPRHLFEGNAFGGFGVTDYAAGVIVGDEAFRNNVEKQNRDGKENGANQNRERAMLEHQLQRPAITAQQPVVSPLGFLIPLASLVLDRGHPARIFLSR